MRVSKGLKTCDSWCSVLGSPRAGPQSRRFECFEAHHLYNIHEDRIADNDIDEENAPVCEPMSPVCASGSRLRRVPEHSGGDEGVEHLPSEV
jgi:hypothetical protein